MADTNIGNSSAFPIKIDTFYTQENAVFDKTAKSLDGDIIQSAYKNKLDDAMYNVEAELLHAPVVVDSTKDMRVSALTCVLKSVAAGYNYTLYIPDTAADFVARGGLGVRDAVPCVYLTGVRPYYYEYEVTGATTTAQLTTAQQRIKTMWEALSLVSYLPQQFVCKVDVLDEHKLIVKFNPANAVTASTAWANTYGRTFAEGGVGHAGNFIVSLILVSYRAKE